MASKIKVTISTERGDHIIEILPEILKEAAEGLWMTMDMTPNPEGRERDSELPAVPEMDEHDIDMRNFAKFLDKAYEVAQK